MLFTHRLFTADRLGRMTDTTNREADMLLLQESAYDFPQTAVFQQPVIQFHAETEAKLLANAAQWAAKYPNWAILDMKFAIITDDVDGVNYSLAIYVDPDWSRKVD